MTGLIPLVLLWLWGQRCETPGVLRSTLPIWPTPASPPPPMPVFQTAPAQPSADTGTPLSALHALRQDPYPELQSTPAQPAAQARASPATKPRRAARYPVITPLTPPMGPPLPPQKTISVRQIQSVLSARGVKIKRDGLYGPKTAEAWMALAKKKGLPQMISRVNPKTARVVPQTFDALSLPAIP